MAVNRLMINAAALAQYRCVTDRHLAKLRWYSPRYAYASRGKQELSYRQQIARKLRTQYAEGIYRLKYYIVTLKSRLRYTQGHWKRNHWIDHTRLSSRLELFDVEY